MANNTNNTPPEDEKPSTSGIPIIDLLLGIVDRVFAGADGQLLAGRVGAIFAIFLMLFIWFKGEVIAEYYKESKYEAYAAFIKEDRAKKFDAVAQEQLQLVHVSSGADFSAVYVFRPKNLNYFVDLEFYEGKIPDTVDPKNMGGYPVDKTSAEYIEHLADRSFQTETEFTYLPTTNSDKSVKYMYSCPYFNLDNIYSGTISMYWYKKPNKDLRQLDAICNQAARAIGRSR